MAVSDKQVNDLLEWEQRRDVEHSEQRDPLRHLTDQQQRALDTAGRLHHERMTVLRAADAAKAKHRQPKEN